MEKNLTIITESYNALIDAYKSNDAIRRALNVNYANVINAICVLKDTELFTEEEVSKMKVHNQQMWNATYSKCIQVSKEAYTMKIKGE
jgi:hypothetical protein